METLDLGQIAIYLGGLTVLGTILGLVIRGWANVKSFFCAIFNILFEEAKIEEEETGKIILGHLNLHYKRSKFSKRVFGGKYETFKTGKVGHVSYELVGGNTVLFWKNWIPFWFCVTPEKTDEKQIFWGSPKKIRKCSILFFRGTLKIEALIKEASLGRNESKWSNSEKKQRFFIKKIPNPLASSMDSFEVGVADLAWYYEGIYNLIGYNPDQLGLNGTRTPLDNLVFPHHVTEIIQEIKLWMDLRSWYKERAIPWKRGWLLYGPPGTGKSALVRAIAQQLDMPIFSFSLGELLNKELEKAWIEMRAHAPCIALFEDFDNVFHGRDNVYGKQTLADLIKSQSIKNDQSVSSGTENHGKLTFDCLLNCIDGVDKSDGIFLVITTNYVDKLDEAMGRPQKKSDGSFELISTRPGRIDKAIELSYMEKEDKIKLAQKILFDDPEVLACLETTIEIEDLKETPAQFQERCSQLALKSIWNKKKESFCEGKCT